MRAFDPSVYKQRRQTLKKRLGQGQVLLIGNEEVGINFRDNWYPFRQDSNLLYYPGIDKPGIHLLIDIDKNQETIFGTELTIDDIVWTGPLPSLQEIAAGAGIEQVEASNKLQNHLNQSVRHLPPYRSDHVMLLSQLLGISHKEVTANASLELIHAIINQRNYKEDREVEEMNEAVSFSYDMHKAVMKGCRPGLYEYDLVGIAAAIASQHHVSFAYPAILTKRGEVLHNHNHSRKILEDDLILYDGGCESKNIMPEISPERSPKWAMDGPSKDIYDVVYRAFRACEDALKPGVTFKSIHLLGARVIFEGMKDLGFAKGDVDDAVANGAHTLFFQCGLGHMIGLDVHDMESVGEQHVGYDSEMEKSKEFGLKSLRLGRKLEEGFALTVEPGIYIIPELIEMRYSEGLYRDFINYDVLKKYSNFGGIRLEDNYVITGEGSLLFGKDVSIPRSSSEVEEFMQS